MDFFDTICAISTPLGSGGISVIRISGKDSLKIAEKMIDRPVSDLVDRQLVLTNVKGKGFVDRALVVYYKAPKTYTGEDVVEFQCHGGMYLAQGILDECVLSGARLAQNGEFTKRAFLNGKISLDGAEGVIDMINAETESAVRAGYDLLNGELKKRVKVLQSSLTDIFAEIEVSLDYPEESIEFSSREQIKTWLTECVNNIDKLIETFVTGNLVKNGVRCAIVGAPNVGKSSTMNSLLGYSRAIVTDIAGTTRDTLEESFVYKTIKFNLIDTAGIRKSDDIIEKIGIERAYDNLKSADIILFIIDSTKDLSDEYKSLLYSLKGKKVLVCFNKMDIAGDITSLKECVKDFEYIKISAKNENGIDELKEKLFSMVINQGITNGFMITSTRHKDLLVKAKKSLINALKGIDSNVDLDLINIDVVDAWNYIGEITGESMPEDRINTIFDKFCLGK